MRAGFTDAGLPAGLQIVAPRHRDELVLQAAYAYEQAAPWNDRWPELLSVARGAPTGFTVGDVRIAPNLVLAPMSGITDSAYRSVVKELNPGAVGLVVTEFVSIEALARQNLRTHDMLRYRPRERPLAIQLFGA